MHRCLSIHEIITEISSHFDSSLRSESADLSALARTCHAFQDPALDELWRTQETIYNVIRCLPQDLFEANTSRSAVVVLRRAPEDADWARPLFYSNRVRVFAPSYGGSVTFKGLHLDPPKGSWFPRLRTLEWNIYSEDDAFIHSFLSPQLERGSDRISACITQLMHLESLHMRRCSLTLAAVKHIGLLPTLKSLELESLPSELLAHGALPARLFEALVSLQLYHADVRAILTFLHACAGALTKLAVWVSPDETMSEAQLMEFSAVLSSWRRSLTNLVVSRLGADIANDLPYTFNDNAFRPLRGLRHLTSVCIVTPAWIGLSDAGILELARSWTHLRFLALGSNSRTRTVRPTLAALASIAKFVPNLSIWTSSSMRPQCLCLGSPLFVVSANANYQ
ncbi:hypothetical protein B0H13DRAFT_2358729 [Mycena leptocephala]|nr:hypothetical protein B0H13DRAFT_2358729 [Mycena leptocephala]